MLNPALDSLADYPFDRLRTLLDGIAPPPDREPRVLSVGEPRHPPPEWLAEILARERAGWGRYPPVDGTPDFRAAAVGWLARRFELPDGFLDPDRHLLPVAGTREALALIAAVAVPRCRNGARPAVLMPNPFYQVYFAAAVLAGAEPVLLDAGPASGGLPDLSDLPRSLLERTALLYLCSPANPQGAVAGLDYLGAAIRLARTHGWALVVDECYSEIYDRTPPPSALRASAILDAEPEGVLVFHSLSKRSSVPGLRSGFVAGDARLIAAFRRLRSFAGAAVPLPVLAASAALWRDEAHVATNRTLYRTKFDLADRLLAGRFAQIRPAGGFFLWLDVGDGERATERLWRREAVRVLPGAYLGRPGRTGVNPGARFVRIALIEDPARTEEALRRLSNAL
jgi:N-succinyldiaminopimelate aminotransferase